MPELIIKYKTKKTLEALIDFSKHLHFTVVIPDKKQEKSYQINGVTIISADNSIDTSDLKAIFTGKNLDFKQLRQSAWQRKK